MAIRSTQFEAAWLYWPLDFQELVRLLLWLVPILLCIWFWVGWLKSEIKFPEPRRRSVSALVGYALSSSATLLSLIFFIGVVVELPSFNQYVRPFPPLVPVFYIAGFFLGISGQILGATGAGKLKWPAVGLGMWQARVWFLAAMSS